MVEYCLKNDESVLFKPHPTDLSKFIMCNNYGILFEMHCPTGTLFDAQLKICNHNYGSTSCGDCEIINDIGDSMAPKWLTKPTKPTKITTTKQTTTTVKPFDDYDIVSNCSDFAFDGFRYIIVWALPAPVPCGIYRPRVGVAWLGMDRLGWGTPVVIFKSFFFSDVR